MYSAKKLSAILCMGFTLPVFAQHQDATSPLAGSAGSAGLSIGKAKVVSVEQLDPAARGVAEKDLALQARFAAGGGVETVPDDAAYIKTHYASRAVYWAESKIRKNLKSDWTDVSRSELQGYKYEAFVPEGPSKTGPWSSYTRVFKRPDGVLVMLHEWDYALDGGGVMIVKELMNEHVHQYLARSIVRKTKSGQYISELTWASDRKYYTLTVWDKLNPSGGGQYDKSWLVTLAERITQAH